MLIVSIHFNKANSQDSTIHLSPILLGAWFTASPTDWSSDYLLPSTNPLMILDVPMVIGNFYGELRLNYDRNNTWGFYTGRIFSREGRALHIVTPQVGVILGDYMGIAPQLYYNVVHPYFEFNLTNHYAFTWNDRPDFYFNWTDLQIPMFKKFRIGPTVQIFHDANLTTVDPGILIGIRTPGWYAMIATFNPHDATKHFLFFVIQKNISFKYR